MSFTRTSWREQGMDDPVGFERLMSESVGAGYIQGIDIGTRFIAQLGIYRSEGIWKPYRPPLFSLIDDREELTGFKASLGIAPECDLDETLGFIQDTYEVPFATWQVTSPEHFWPDSDEHVFMAGRLPAVRIVPLIPEMATSTVQA